VTARKPAEPGEAVTTEQPAQTVEAPAGTESEADKDAEIARLREEAAESDRKLAALLAGQDIGAPTEAQEGDVKVTMRLTITGARNGVPWPPAGGSISVPAAEAEQLVAVGYAALAE